MKDLASISPSSQNSDSISMASKEEEPPMASESVWVLDVSRSPNDVKGIVHHLARLGEEEEEPFHMVVYASMEGVDGASVNTLWQKFKKLKAEKDAHYSGSKVILSMRMHVDSEVRWEDSLLRFLRSNKPGRLFAVTTSTTRRVLLKQQTTLVLSPEALPETCQANILSPGRPSGTIKAEVVDLHRLICVFRGLSQVSGRKSLRRQPTPETSALRTNYFSARKMSRQTSDPAARSASRPVLKESDIPLRSPKPFLRNPAKPAHMTVSSVWSRSSVWLSGLRTPKDNNAGNRRTARIGAPERLSQVGMANAEHEPKVFPTSTSARKRFVACSGPLEAPCPPRLMETKSFCEGRAMKATDDIDAMRIKEQMHQLQESEVPGSRPFSQRGPEEAGDRPRLMRPGKRKVNMVPKSTPLGAAAEQAHREMLQRCEESPACTYDQISQSSDESSRSRDATPRSHTGSPCSWGSPWIPSAPSTPVLQRTHSRCREFSADDLLKATDSFAQANLLGRGTSGTVHKGCLSGCPVVVKKLPLTGSEAETKFRSAVSLLSTVRHPNLVLLVGHCSSESAVVYEYMDGGTLAQRIKMAKDSGPPLKWYDRVRIASEVTSTLLFLHCQSPPIVHGDLRPENIFLDYIQRSKLCDVGLGAVLERQDDTGEHWVNSKALRYVEPRELSTGDITRMSDVYALGLVLLQLILGEADVRTVHKLLQFANRAHPKDIHKQSSTLVELVDESGGMWPAPMAEQAISLALECTSPDCRPSLQERVQPQMQILTDKIQMEQRRRKADLQQQLTCPLSKEQLADPVIAADGLTYERKHIEAWLESHDTSPVTGMPLPHKFLTPNLVVQNIL